jgi:hypothetical protein
VTGLIELKFMSGDESRPLGGDGVRLDGQPCDATVHVGSDKGRLSLTKRVVGRNDYHPRTILQALFQRDYGVALQHGPADEIAAKDLQIPERASGYVLAGSFGIRYSAEDAFERLVVEDPDLVDLERRVAAALDPLGGLMRAREPYVPFQLTQLDPARAPVWEPPIGPSDSSILLLQADVRKRWLSL